VRTHKCRVRTRSSAYTVRVHSGIPLRALGRDQLLRVDQPDTRRARRGRVQLLCPRLRRNHGGDVVRAAAASRVRRRPALLARPARNSSVWRTITASFAAAQCSSPSSGGRALWDQRSRHRLCAGKFRVAADPCLACLVLRGFGDRGFSFFFFFLRHAPIPIPSLAGVGASPLKLFEQHVRLPACRPESDE
jgi:hypothetical protein